MNALENPNVDLDRRFEHLPNAPIVEAVIHWTARAENKWEPDRISTTLAQRLPNYSDIKQDRAITFGVITDLMKAQASHRKEWIGVRLTDPIRHQIAQFKRDGLVFSQLKPYERWESFENEARRLWGIFVELGAPSQVQRLGVRFINKIPMASISEIPCVLKEPPTQPLGLPLSTFLCQSSFDAPDTPFGLKIRKAFEAGQLPKSAESSLILDIDVFTTAPFICDESRLDDYLPKMRYLKNGAFFSLLTDGALTRFRGSNS